MDDKYYHCLTLHHKSNHQEKSDEAPESEPMEIDQARYSQPEHSDKPIDFISGMELLSDQQVTA